ncbi:transposase [Methanoplanus endosymbiosus]|uniref:Transposase n=1 Tax=Methanoplanus endosymbiosus TaxID=33865 RepID=A0A9E7PKC0_9EURY|nr:transposase [Methanoplanus endosymbiosus]UUX91670.1 transposase [Methanoplanus endosymbiosus]UUX93243.1 transposase [Methanoplanus endosymbiosus]
MAIFGQKNSKIQSDTGLKLGKLELICDIIEDHISFPDGRYYDSKTIVRGTIAAACSKNSISGLVKMTDGLPSHTTCLKYLHNIDMEKLESDSSKILLLAGEGIIIEGRAYNFAIDKTLKPYYGVKDEEEDPNIIRNKKKASTTKFFAYMTLSIVDQDKHLTLLVIPWKDNDNNLDGIKTCVELIRSLGLKIKCLMLDREFYTGKIFSYLKESDVPHLMPVKQHGEELKKNLKGKKSKSFKHTLNSKSKFPLEIEIVDCIVYQMGKKGKNGVLHRAFVVYKVCKSPKSIRRLYKHRFAIESTYVLANKSGARTSTKDPVVRFYYFLISFIIQNHWVSIKWKRFAKLQRGPKVIYRDRFPLHHFITILIKEAWEHFHLLSLNEIAIS